MDNEVMNMNKRFNRVLLGFIVCLVVCVVGTQNVQAAESKASIQKKITNTKKEIAKLKKQKSAAVKKENAAKKGTKYISGSVICSNPLIIEQNNLFSYSYYWVNNPSAMNNLLFYAFGYVVPTGKYKTYNGITCVECKAKKITIKSTSIQKKIDSKNKALKIYQNALKESVVIKNQTVVVGSKTKIKASWKYGGKYNSVKWSSSNKSVATIDKSGKITAKKIGTTTITDKASISGKTTKCKVTVTSKIKDLEFEKFYNYIYTGDLPDSNKTTLKLKYNPSNSLENITFTSSNKDVVEIVSYTKGKLTIKFNGTLDEAEIKAKTSSGVTAYCMVKFFDTVTTELSFDKDVINIYEDELDSEGEYELHVLQDEYACETYEITSINNDDGTLLDCIPVSSNEILLLLGNYGTATIEIETTRSKLKASCTINYQKTRGNHDNENNYDDNSYYN